MRATGEAGRLAAVLALLALGLAGLALGAADLVRRDREALVARAGEERQVQLEQAARSVSESLNDVADNLHLASELLGQPGSQQEHQRELWALLEAVAQDKAIAIYGPDGAPQLTLVDPAAPPPAGTGLAAAAMAETGRKALGRPSGEIVASLPVPPEPPGWYRVFSSSLAAEGPGGSVAVLVDTEPFFAPLKVLGGARTRLLLLGSNGRAAPLSDPGLAGWYGRADRAAASPALASALARVRQGERGVARLTEEEAGRLGLERAEALAVFTPIPMKGTAGWSLLALDSTAPLRAHERQVLLRVSLAALLGTLFLAAFAAYAVVASRRAVALRESRRHAERLAHLHEKTQKILDHIPTGVLALSADGRVSAVNRALQARVPALAPGDPLAKAFAAAPPEAAARVRALLDEAMAQARPRSLPGEVSPLFGEEGQFSLHAVPLSPSDPEVRALLVIEDLSEVRSLEAQLLRAEKLATVGVLAAGIAHEVGTPLGVVRGRAEYLLQKLGEAHPQAGGARVIVEQIDRVSRTIHQLLDFSRLKPAAVLPVEPAAALTSVRELLRIEAERRGLSLELEAEPGLRPAAADPDQLQQVLVNLALNAFDASARGGKVTLGARAGGEGLLLWVEDQGVGIPTEHVHRVFDPFFTTKKRGQGTGLGLAIVDQIVRNHRGRVEIHSEPGRGTRVEVIWPVAPSEVRHVV